MAVIEGQRSTDQLSAFRVHHDLHRRILELEPNYQPLVVFLNNIYNGGRSLRTKTWKFRWPEFELDDRFDAIDNSGGYTNTDTVLVVVDDEVFYPEALVKVPRTKEVMRVVSVDAGASAITVERGYGLAAAVALEDNESLFVIAQAREEGDVSQAARAREPVEVFNFTQIFRRWVEESGTRHSSDEDTQPHDWRFQQHEQMIEHQKDKELAFWFGTRGEEDGTTKKVRTTAGVEEFATANNDSIATLTEEEFEDWLRPGLRFGDPNNKILVISRKIGSILNNFSQGKLQTSVGDKTYGVQINRWLSAHGEVRLISHPLFEGLYEGHAFLLDLAKGKAAYRYVHGTESPGRSRDTHMLENVQEPDRDGRKDEIRAECGLQLALPKAHAVLTGVTEGG